MKVNFAHLRERSTNAGWVDFAVFDADATSHGNEDRGGLLLRLTLAARSNGLKVDKAVLVYRENGRIRTWGAPDIVKYLSSMGVPQWTHYLDF